MIFLDLIVNLSLLVALTIVSGFIDRRWPRSSRPGMLAQGVLFGAAAVIGMLRPLHLGPGLIFDGRSVMISLCALFFGPWAAAVCALMAVACRTWLGGVGTLTGALVVLSSTSIGLLAHFRFKPNVRPPSIFNLYLFGVAVHLAMLAMMFTLPSSMLWTVLQRVGLPVIILFPLATILSGKILSDQVEAAQVLARLREREERYSELFNHGREPVFVHRLEAAGNPGLFSEVNDAACERLGYSRQVLLTMLPQNIVDDQSSDAREIFTIPPSVGHSRFETVFVGKGGERIPVEVSSRVFESKGECYVLSVARDISERLLAEEALRKSEERFRISFDADYIGRSLTDVNGRLQYVNGRLCEMLGYRAEELNGLSFADITHPDDLEASRECVRCLLAGEMVRYRLEKRYIRKDRSVLWTDLSTTLVRDQDGRPMHFITGIQDISERKLAEQKLLEKVIELQHFRDMVVGRELVMIELKKEVNDLLRRLGRPEKYRIVA